MKNLNLKEISFAIFSILAEKLVVKIKTKKFKLADQVKLYQKLYLWDWEDGLVVVDTLERDTELAFAILCCTGTGEKNFSESRYGIGKFSHLCVHDEIAKVLYVDPTAYDLGMIKKEWGRHFDAREDW